MRSAIAEWVEDAPGVPEAGLAGTGARPRRGKREVCGLLTAAAAVLAASMVPSTPAGAQVGTPPSQGSSPLPPAPPERIEPAPPAADGSGGVLRPPLGIDPGIRTTVPNPAPGTTPVIPPPGTPGGDPASRPR